MTPTLVFDIETVPDVAGLRKLHDFDEGLADADVAELAFQRRRAQVGHDFLPLHLHRVVAISCALREGTTFKVWSLGTPKDDEATLIQRFFDGIEKYTPQIVSWNGGGFDLPVLHYRGLIHGVTASKYWDLGDDDRDFKWNNYISRYHMRHTDLMDLLAMYQPRGAAPLDQLAKLMGLPGKLGMNGSQVWGAYTQGEIGAIRDYCETDVVNTYLVFLRFQKMRGILDAAGEKREVDLIRATLSELKGAHWREFLGEWGS
ncbi:MAG: 3'-5' exonuclease [Burkholderiales bacterium]